MIQAIKNWWKKVKEWGNSTTPYRPIYQDSVPPLSEWADSCPVSDWDVH